jgi:hypothetical protein
MSSNINLVSPKNEQLEKEQRRLKAARILALLVVVFVAILAVVIFIVNLTVPLNAIKQQEDVTLTKLVPLHKKLVQYYFVEDRVDNLSNIIAARKNLSGIADAIAQIVPSGVSISSLEIDSKQVTLIVYGSSLLPMNQFIDGVTMISTQKKLIKNVVAQQVSVDVRNGTYSVSVQADIK